MDFSFNIGTAIQSINDYKKQYQILADIGEEADNTIDELTQLGWSGEAKDSFLKAHEEKKKRYEKLEDDMQIMINILEEAKQRV